MSVLIIDLINFIQARSQKPIIHQCPVCIEQFWALFLPHANEVWGKVMFLHLSVYSHDGGLPTGRFCIQGGGGLHLGGLGRKAGSKHPTGMLSYPFLISCFFFCFCFCFGGGREILTSGPIALNVLPFFS